MNPLRLICLLALITTLATNAWAHDGEVTWSFNSIGEGAAHQVIHEDESPFKGWFTATVTNTAQDPWGDFHFELIRDLGFGTPSLVVFDDSTFAFEMLDTNNDPWPNYSYVVSQDALSTDFYFYSPSAWVNPGQTVIFKVYTDNTANEQFFGMKLYPTPIPEPASMALLLAGSLILLRRRDTND